MIKRILRYIFRRCIVCGKQLHNTGKRYFYCSFTCAAYDGVFSVNLDSEANKRKPRLLKGYK